MTKNQNKFRLIDNFSIAEMFQNQASNTHKFTFQEERKETRNHWVYKLNGRFFFISFKSNEL